MSETLLSKGISVSAWDPHLKENEFPEDVSVISDVYSESSADIAILVTAHKACLTLDWDKLLKAMNRPIIYDGRRVLNLEQLEEKGWQVHAVGRP